jgi:hypothetical protein
MKISIIALVLLLPFFNVVTAGPLIQHAEGEAYDWGGIREIGERGNFPPAPEGQAYFYRVWLKRPYLSECTYRPRCTPERLVIWLGSSDLGGRPALFQTRSAFSWKVVAIENGATPLGDGQCVMFVLQETYWKNGMGEDEDMTRDHRVCLKAETGEEVNKRFAQQKRKQRATALSKPVK